MLNYQRVNFLFSMDWLSPHFSGQFWNCDRPWMTTAFWSAWMPTTHTFPRCQLNGVDGAVERKGGSLLMPWSNVIIYIYIYLCRYVQKPVDIRLIAVWNLHSTWCTGAAARFSHGAESDWRTASIPSDFKSFPSGTSPFFLHECAQS